MTASSPLHHTKNARFSKISFSLDHSSVPRDLTLCTFLSKTLYALEKRSPSKFSDFWLLAWKLTKFLMLLFKPRVSFPLILHHPSMSWYIVLMKFSSWNIICFGQKYPSKVQFFRFLSALMKFYPIPHAIFKTTRSGFIQILHRCSVSWKITSLYFCWSNLVYFKQKEPIEKKLLDIRVAEWKLTKFLLHIWNHKSVFL